MSRVLFIGNSHLSAFKHAHATRHRPDGPDCSFFCARGADLAFTELVDGALRPSPTAQLDAEIVRFGLGGQMTAFYLEGRQPTEDVGLQFRITGGAEAIDLDGVSVVFHVLGASPYDFLRLGEPVMPVARPLRRWLLGRMLGDKYLLRPQMEAMRRLVPNTRHFLIGMPLPAEYPEARNEAPQPDIVAENRHVIASMARDFLFDDVFMPDEDLLDETLIRTRMEYTRGGCQQAEVFQNRLPTQSDHIHMNQTYGEAVYDRFVQPRLPAAVTAAG